VAAVLGFHFAPGLLPGGFLGVDLFFVLSGYLITRLIATEFLRTGRFRFGRFYLRRARRLLPGLAAVLVGGLAAAAFWRDQLLTVRPAALAAVGYASNWWLSYAHQSYFVSAGRPSMLQHLWSLAVEEQFYLLWPLLAVGVLARTVRAGAPAARARRLAALAVALALASATEMLLIARAENIPLAADASRLYYGTDTHSMGLLLGAAVGAWAAGRRREAGQPAHPDRPRVWVTDGLAAAALAGLVLLMCGVDETDPALYRGGFLLVAVLGAVAVGAVARRRSRLGRLLDRRPLRWLAARSYALYLWHWPVAVVTRPGVDLAAPPPAIFVLRVAVSLVLADLTYRWLERPLRRFGLRGSLRRGGQRIGRIVGGQAPVGARLAAAAGAAVLLLAGAVLADAPRARLSAGQQALAHGPGGRDLRLQRPARPARLSPVARVATSGIHTELPPPAPTSSRPGPSRSRAPAPAVSAYGDSVMLGARNALTVHFAQGRMDAVEGRQPDPILRDIEHDARARRLNPLVVIGVGDNGLITPDQLRHTLACLRSVPRVVVINNRVGRPWEGPNNRLIAQLAPRFANVRLLDWHAASAGHPSWFYDDHIHLTPRGALAYSALIAAAARRP
jgi:peptidoglycan/LPS O-acetylase OafA/YrhL